MEEERKRKSSASAMYLLYAEGCCLLLLGTVVLVCGFIVNFHKDFDAVTVEAQFDYPQYWVGLTFFVTSFVAIAAGSHQENRWLVLSALILFLICIFASLLGLVAEGNDWIRHKNAVRRKSFWDSEENYDCRSESSRCVCINSITNKRKWISRDLDCDMLSRLNYIYGGVLCCVLAGVFFTLSSIIILVIFIPLQHFTIPEPKRKIRRITILEEKDEKRSPVAVHKPRQVEQPEIEEIVVREVRPKRRRTIVYDEPIPQVRPQPKHFLDPTEAPVETQPREQLTSVDKLERRETERVISHVYDEGRLVTQPRPRPSQQLPPVFDERKFIANPNFGKKSPRKTQVYRFGEAAPSPIIVRRQKPVYSEEPVVRERLLVHSGDPHVNQERRLVPVQKRSFVYTEERPRMYTMERSRAYIDEVSRGLVQGRPRANSDEERVFIDGRGRVYTSKRSRKYTGEIQRVVRQGRPRANSDGGPPEYSGDKPRMFTEEFIPAATPVITMQTQPPNARGYDKQLENNLQSANKWSDRPPTPY